jgi:hypothetical protein
MSSTRSSSCISRVGIWPRRYDSLLQGLKLKAAAGELRESDVSAINALFVEQANK